MFKWDSVLEWGRRASDSPVAAPISQTRDPLLESAIAHEQIEVLYQPLIEPLSGRRHQIRRHFKHVAHPLVGDTQC